MTKLIFIIISFSFFTAYLIYTIVRRNVQRSISETYYHIRKPLIFTASIAFSSFPLAFVLPDPLMFVAAGLICFVAAAPAFKDHRIEKIAHYVGAFGGYGLATFDLALQGLGGFVLLAAGLCVAIWGAVKNYVFWIEVLAYYFILTCLTCLSV